MMKHTTSRIVVAAMVCAAAFLAACQSSAPRAETPTPGSTGSILYPGVDRYHFPITTDSAECQQWFDQGIQLVFGFNHLEAMRSFQEAAARDPDAPMPWWGIAYCWGANINDPAMTKDKYKHATEAIHNANLRLDRASDIERSLIEALAVRYEYPETRPQRELDGAYADAMQRVWNAHRGNPDVGAFYAESLMNLQPWNLWTHDGQPKGRILEICAVLEESIASDNTHPLANHLYIHAMEASPAPDKALASAAVLENRIPGSGHLVHMPSHIYVRTGQYAKAEEANEKAVEIDRAFFAEAPPAAIYYMYYGHNLHFLAFAAMMEGRYETALRAARDLEAEIPVQAVREFAFVIEGLMSTSRHVMIRFGKWDQILLQPAPPPKDMLVSTAVHHYSRGVALAALGRPEEARVELTLFDGAAAKIPADWFLMQNKISDILPVARCMLVGEILFREKRFDESFAVLRTGVEYEDALVYDEPPGWMIPVRHALGALLMDAGRYAEAEAVYRQDLTRNRGNGWSLVGLKLALEAQNQFLEAGRLNEPIEVAFARADIKPTSSCMCAP